MPNWTGLLIDGENGFCDPLNTFSTLLSPRMFSRFSLKLTKHYIFPLTVNNVSRICYDRLRITERTQEYCT